MKPSRAIACLATLTATLWGSVAQAYVVDIDAGSRAIYLRVGDGRFTGLYAFAGSPRSGGNISTVAVSLAASQIGNGNPQPMSSNGRTSSDWDGYEFCEPGQLYVGGFFRRPGNAQGGAINAELSVTAPATLTNAAGNNIPISEISWTSSGNGDGNATQPVPSGTFTGGRQVLATNFFRNTWRESCLSFSYANSQIVGAGTYTARVTYTLAVP